MFGGRQNLDTALTVLGVCLTLSWGCSTILGFEESHPRADEGSGGSGGEPSTSASGGSSGGGTGGEGASSSTAGAGGSNGSSSSGGSGGADGSAGVSGSGGNDASGGSAGSGGSGGTGGAGGSGGTGGAPELMPWGDPVVLQEAGEDATWPNVAMDGNGNAIAAWVQGSGGETHIWASGYYAGGAEVLEPQQIEDETGAAYRPDVAMDANGNALVVWFKNDDSGTNAFLNRFVGSTRTWGGTQPLEGDTQPAGYPDVAADSDGNAIVSWVQYNGSVNDLWARYYHSDTGPFPAELIEDVGFSVEDLFVEMHPSGDALVGFAWDTDQNPDEYELVAAIRRYDREQETWGAVQQLSTEDGSAADLSIAASADGSVVAVWTQWDPDNSYWDVWASRYDPGDDEWSQALLLEDNDVGSATGPEVEMDDAGNAIVVWEQDGNLRSNVWASRYDAELMTWSEPEILDAEPDDDPDDAFYALIAASPNGDATALWLEGDNQNELPGDDLEEVGEYKLRASHYSAALGEWSRVGGVGNDNLGPVRTPISIAMDSTGAVAVWVQRVGGGLAVFANRLPADF